VPYVGLKGKRVRNPRGCAAVAGSEIRTMPLSLKCINFDEPVRWEGAEKTCLYAYILLLRIKDSEGFLSNNGTPAFFTGKAGAFFMGGGFMNN